jgi:beta-phosphoglucomutase
MSSSGRMLSRGVIWDMDGVILDSADQHWQAWRMLASQTNTRFTEADFRHTFGQRNADIIPHYWQVTDPDEIQRLADRKEALYREMLATRAHALPGAIALMQGLQAAGWHQALGSSAPIENIQLILDLLDLRTLLEAVVSGEDAPQGKPAPDIFLAAARALNLSPANCVVIEDAVAGVQAAQAAGMRCIAVTNGRFNRELQIADRVVQDLTEVTVDQIAGMVG